MQIASQLRRRVRASRITKASSRAFSAASNNRGLPGRLRLEGVPSVWNFCFLRLFVYPFLSSLPILSQLHLAFSRSAITSVLHSPVRTGRTAKIWSSPGVWTDCAKVVRPVHDFRGLGPDCSRLQSRCALPCTHDGRKKNALEC